MDWKIVIATFGTVFLAELGDKTQLATLLYATEAKNPWLIFIGAATALVLSTLIAVLLGHTLSKYVPVKIVHIVAGLGFIFVGVWVLFGAIRNGGAAH